MTKVEREWLMDLLNIPFLNMAQYHRVTLSR